MKNFIRAGLLLALLVGICASATEISWQQTLSEENTWSRLNYAGTLLVASENALAHYDPATGDRMWLRDDLRKLAQFNVRDINGTPFLAVNQPLGNIPPKSQLQVLNIATGETLWDTGVVAGYALGGYPVPNKDLLVLAANLQGGNGTKAGIYLIGLTLTSGEEKWRTRLGGAGSVPVYNSDTSGFIPVPDFSGHPQPVITDNTFVLVAGDLFAVDINTGEEKWRFKLKASTALKQTYAQPLLVDGVLYAVSKDSMYAIDMATGNEKWKAKIGKSTMPQIEMVNNLIVGRMGGTFSNGKDIVQKKPFGAFAVDTTTGMVAWKWTKAKDSVTNLRILPEQGLVMLADKKKLYALELNAQKKGKVVYQEDLEFKRKMGSADLAAKGIGAAGGFLGGGLAGGFKSLGGGGDRGDPPLDIELYEDQLIIRAQFHVLAHNIQERMTDWSIEFAPPGMSPFALVAMGAITAFVAVESAGPTRAAGGGWTSQSMLDSTLAISNSFEAAVTARYAAAEKGKNNAFFLTKEEEGMLLVGIDLSSGEEVGRIPMAEKEPQFMVDAIGSRVYYFKDKTELVAYDF
ncbi:MAG: outer membrane protein assembly factor BamB family protein [Paracoccaceae bacterium]